MALNTNALGRRVPPCAEKPNPDHQIVAVYVNRLIEYARPEDMLRDLGLVSGDAAVRVTYRGGTHLSQVLRDTNQFRFAVPPCRCGLPDGKHLCLPNCTWIPDCFPDVVRMLSKGLNHVPCAPLDACPVIEQNVRIAVAFGGACVANAARDWTVTRLSRAKVAPVDAVDFSTRNPGVRHILQVCFVSSVDKAANQPMFICKHLAVSMALEHCRSTPAFLALQHMPFPHDVVAAMHAVAPCIPLLESVHPRFSTLYPVVKVHKEGWRFITSAVGTVYHDAAVLVQATSACMLHALQEYCGARNRAALLSGCRVQHYPLIPDTRHCIVNVNPGERHLCDFSADVDHCFDVIPHGDLLHALKSHADRVVQMYRRTHGGKEPCFIVSSHMTDGHLEVSNVTLTHRAPAPRQMVVSVADWLTLCGLLLDNCVLQVAGLLFRVIAGIPQGLHCSPDWCNLFLLHHEISFVHRNVHDAHDVLLHWFRQVDDMRVLIRATEANLARNMSVAEWHAYLKRLLSRVYPAPLTLSLTCSLADACDDPPVLCTTNFLDLCTELLPSGHLSVSIIRKEKKLPIPVCQYVHLDSNRPVFQCYSVLSGLVSSVVWRCTRPTTCLAEIKHLCRKFIANGHAKSRLLRVVDACMKKDYSCLHLEYDPAKLWLANRWQFARDL